MPSSSPTTVPPDASNNASGNSGNAPGNSPSNSPSNAPDTSGNTPTVPGIGYDVSTNQYTDSSSNVVYTHTTFITTDVSSDVQITEDLSGNAGAYYDDTSGNLLLNQIQFYAGQIKCSDFHGKGTVDDYTELFVAASKIANDAKHMQLDVDIDGFSEFADAADQLSALFTSFITKLENVNIIDDTAFLTQVANALQKIWHLSEVFGKFKQTILATTTVQLPKSTQKARQALESVMDEVHCAMKYINYFVDSSANEPVDAELSAEESGIISAAVSTIENWATLCDQGVSIAMSSNPDIQYIQTASVNMAQTTTGLSTATTKLRSKLARFNLSC